MKNKPTLLFYISVSLTILLFCSIIIIGILLSKLNFDNNKYHTLFKYIQKTEITNQDIEKQQFKEDYYIEQQSSDTSLILTVFGVTAIVFGVFSYTLFESRINEHKNYYSDKIADQESKYCILKFHLDDLLKNIASDKAYENMIKAKENYIKQNYEWYIYFSLEAVC